MVSVPFGSFEMGSPSDEPGRNSDETQHIVTLTEGFHIGKYPVTQAQYQAVIGTNPSYFKTPVSSETNTANRPVEQVSWYDAVEFCNKLSDIEGLTPYYTIDKNTVDPNNTNSGDPYRWLVTLNPGANGYRLPTEAQWEYACRAGTTHAFNWDTDTINSSQANYYASYIDPNNKVAGTYLQRTTSVGSYAPNTWGIYDMHGNVWEWCWDWYGSYSGDKTDPTGAVSGGLRVLRGGSWYGDGQYLRSADRNCYYPYYWDSYYYGFRVVLP